MDDGAECWEYLVSFAEGGVGLLVLRFHDGALIDASYDDDRSATR